MGERPLSRQELRQFLSQVRLLEDPIDGRALMDAEAELRRYAEGHARAAELSLAVLARHLSPDGSPRVLELGGAPYYFSALMHHVFGARLTAVNVQAGAWPGEPPRLSGGRVALAIPGEGAGGRLSIEVRVVNVEKDPFPFASASFDAVLCMEVLEHLGYSPSHMLAEVHRVLVPGGLLFLTVPNLINIKRLVRLFFNRTTEVRYSGYGIYGRHQREFAPYEVAQLLSACHFRVVELATANVWPVYHGNLLTGVGNFLLNALTSLPLPWLAAKREYILCAARSYGEPVAAYPSWLYSHRHLYPPPPHGVPKVLDE